MNRIDLTAGCWLRHEPGWLAGEEADAMLASLSGSLAFEQRTIVLFGREIMQPRLVAWAGELPYRYSGRTLPPRPAPSALSELLARVDEATDHRFNHVLANLYRDGEDSMGMHADDEPELGPSPLVASVSLGAPRRFVFAPKKRRPEAAGPGSASQSLTLSHGDLLVMGGRFQHLYRHGVPKERRARGTGPRLSLTFRRIERPPAGAELG